ncbi:MAG: hypothetical protein HGA65_17700 [Oscillochloris sp.]|nr:hypothetical protein [Oscillochloris sp.]
MSVDQSFREQNRTSTERIRLLVAHLSDEQLLQPVGAHWTIATTLIHIAFWDRRVLDILNRSEQEGTLITPTIDVVVNDFALPFWAAILPRTAAQLAIDAAATLDARLEACHPALLADLYARNERWVNRAIHRGQHLDEIDRVLSAAR